MKTALTGATIFTGEEFLENHAVVLSGTGIEAVLPAVSLSQDIILTELPGGTLAPGFIDLQVNGGGGVLFNNDPSADCVRSIRDAHRSCGTTALLPTVISDSSAVREAAVRAVQACIAAGDEGVLGIHIEGPFLSAERRGVHQAEYLQTLSQADLDWLLGLGQGLGELPVMLTLAPEQVQAGDIARLAAGGIKVCAGHTAASYETTLAALREGLVGFTHLYNGMPPPAGREPGVVAAALEDSGSWCGIICDGFHVDVAMIRLAWRAKAAGKLYLVSDGMATVGSSATGFDLYGEAIQLVDGKLINGEGRLAGSAIGMCQALQVAVQQVGIPLAEALRMAALYPAQLMGLAGSRGCIDAGFRADLVHFDDSFSVTTTWLAGEPRSHY